MVIAPTFHAIVHFNETCGHATGSNILYPASYMYRRGRCSTGLTGYSFVRNLTTPTIQLGIFCNGTDVFISNGYFNYIG